MVAAQAAFGADSSHVELDSTASAKADSGKADTVHYPIQFYDYIAYPVLQALTLPIELGVVPVVKGIIYPTKAPLRYILNEDVIDRTIKLISFGPKDNMMVYPTLNLAPGTGSNTGLTLRHNSIFGRSTERLVVFSSFYVNGDWRLRTYLTANKILGTEFDSKLSFYFVRVKNTSVNQPGTNSFWTYADSSNSAYLSVGHRLFEKVGWQVKGVFRQNRYGLTPSQKDSLVSPFFLDPETGLYSAKLRGLEDNWHDGIVVFGVGRDTRNNENIPLSGSDFNFNWQYHFTDADHNFHGWDGRWTGFFKLGKERYEISSEEEKKSGGMNLKKMLKQVEYKTLKEQLFNRKVVALNLFAAQSFEVPGNRMPAYGLQTLGNDTPMRGYGGSRFKDYVVAAVSGEYRFPVMRLVDGTIFDEYGVFGRSWEKVDFMGSLKNSWGFGIRVRRPDIYLFRAQAGFHGLHGITINLSVDAPF